MSFDIVGVLRLPIIIGALVYGYLYDDTMFSCRTVRCYDVEMTVISLGRRSIRASEKILLMMMMLRLPTLRLFDGRSLMVPRRDEMTRRARSPFIERHFVSPPPARAASFYFETPRDIIIIFSLLACTPAHFFCISFFLPPTPTSCDYFPFT